MKHFVCLILLGIAVCNVGSAASEGNPHDEASPMLHGGGQGPLDPEKLARLREVLKEANQVPAVVEAREVAREALEKLRQKLGDEARSQSPEIAAKLDAAGFDWGHQPRRRVGRGPRPREGGARQGPPPRANEGARALKELSVEERQAFRELMRGLIREPSIREMQRETDRLWRDFKETLRAEVKRIDPELHRELRRHPRWREDERGGRRGPRPGRGPHRGGPPPQP